MTDTSLVFNILAKEQMSGTLDKLKGVAAGAGVAIGAALTVGIQKNLDISTSNAKLQGQLGLTEDVAGKAGEVAGEVYRDNFGASIADVNVALRAVGSNMVDLKDVSKAELAEITKSAMGVASTFDVEVNEATRAAGVLVKNKLAPDFKSAFDLITRSFQEGGDRAGDLLDTISEYSPQFAKLGLDGNKSLGIMVKGLQAGARDTDVIADAIKEFGIRAIDTAELTTDAYKDLGLSADGMRKKIAAGGPAATTAMSEIVRALMRVKDPVKQNEIGVALFGTQWEDTARKILPALDPMAAGMTDVAGATDKMNKAVGDTPQAKINEVTRTMEGWLNTLIELPGPMGATAAAAVAFGAPALSMLGDVGALKTAFSGLNPELAKAKQNIDGVGTSSRTSGVHIGGFGKAAGIATVGLLAVNGAMAGLDQGNITAGISTKGLARDLEEYGRTGQKSGEVAELLGQTNKGLGQDLGVLAGGAQKWAIGFGNFMEGITGISDASDISIKHSRQRIATLDQALAQLVTSGHPEAAKDAFAKLVAEGDKVGISVEEMKRGFPAFVVAAKDAGVILDEIAKPRTPFMGPVVAQAARDDTSRKLNQLGLARKVPMKPAVEGGSAIENALNKLARNRRTAVTAYGSADAAERSINHAARNRSSTIFVSADISRAASNINRLRQLEYQGRAGGGPVRAGTPYIVGEKRPELFVPDVDGTILPQVPSAARLAGLTARQISAMDDAGRFAYAGSNKLPPAPSGFAWAEDYSLVPTSFYGGKPKAASRPVMAPASVSAGQRIVLEFRSSGAAVDDFLVERVAKAVKVRGGNVQVVLGQRRT